MHTSNITTFLSIFDLVVSATVPWVKFILFPKSHGRWEKWQERNSQSQCEPGGVAQGSRLLQQEALCPCTATSSIFPLLVWGEEVGDQPVKRKSPCGDQGTAGMAPCKLGGSWEKRTSQSAGAVGCRSPGLTLPREKGLHWWGAGAFPCPYRALVAEDSPGQNR